MTSYGSHRLKPSPVIGYTTRRHLLLDLDYTSLSKAIKLVKMIMDNWAKVGDCLICQSSHSEYMVTLNYYGDGKPFMKRRSNSYHLIFDNGIGWNLCVKICQVLASLNVLERDYVKIRRFRGDMTLRVSPAALMKGDKPNPRPVYMIFNNATDRADGYIWQYYETLMIARQLFLFKNHHRWR